MPDALCNPFCLMCLLGLEFIAQAAVALLSHFFCGVRVVVCGLTCGHHGLVSVICIKHLYDVSAYMSSLPCGPRTVEFVDGMLCVKIVVVIWHSAYMGTRRLADDAWSNLLMPWLCIQAADTWSSAHLEA
jgi:hypothetical protein